MSTPTDPAEKPTYEELDDRIRKVFHFLQEWGYGPDADDWTRYHTMVTIRLLTGQSLKGTLLFHKKTGQVTIISKDGHH